jgi:hypothetical protein
VVRAGVDLVQSFVFSFRDIVGTRVSKVSVVIGLTFSFVIHLKSQ